METKPDLEVRDTV